MTDLELGAELEHLIEMIKQLQEEVKSLKRDVYVLQSGKTAVTHIGTFVK
jgi:hypothetical protein